MRALPLTLALSVSTACGPAEAPSNPSTSEPPGTDCADAEVPYNGIDDDCDASTPDDDLDGDGALLAEDCDDDDDARYPGAPDVGWNGVDEDCDGTDLGSTAAVPAVRAGLGSGISGLGALSAAVDATHAVTVGLQDGALRGWSIELASGDIVAFTLLEDLVDAEYTMVYPRPGGFGVAWTDRIGPTDFGCQVRGAVVDATGSMSEPTVLQDQGIHCHRGVQGTYVGDEDWIFFVSEQDGGSHPQIARQVADLDTRTLGSFAAHGVNQSGRGGTVLDVVSDGVDAYLAYDFTYDLGVKLSVWDAVDLQSPDIYGGELEVFPEAPGAGYDPRESVHLAMSGELAFARALVDDAATTSDVEIATVAPADPPEEGYVQRTGGAASPALPITDRPMNGDIALVSRDAGFRLLWGEGDALIGGPLEGGATSLLDDTFADDALVWVVASAQSDVRSAVVLIEERADDATLWLISEAL